MITAISQIQVSNTSFGSRRKAAKEATNVTLNIATDTILSRKAINYIKKADEAIEIAWGKIKKKKNFGTTPEFKYTADSSGTVVTLRPAYGTQKESLMFQIDKKDGTQKFLIERGNPNNFRYEKIIATPTGSSATVKSLTSPLEKDAELAKALSSSIEEYFPKLIDFKKLQD